MQPSLPVQPFVVATANVDKAAEIELMLRQVLPSIELVPRPGYLAEVVETGSTLEENARLKAKEACDATGMAAIADDTGFEVDALGGAPGIRAARYAGEQASYADNVRKLLKELGGAPDRGARFRTVALLLYPSGRELVREGCVEGSVAMAPRGTRGFGYDPVFMPLGGGGRTFAEMDDLEKARLSHRGLAFRALAGAIAGSPHG